MKKNTKIIVTHFGHTWVSDIVKLSDKEIVNFDNFLKKRALQGKDILRFTILGDNQQVIENKYIYFSAGVLMNSVIEFIRYER